MNRLGELMAEGEDALNSEDMKIVNALNFSANNYSILQQALVDLIEKEELAASVGLASTDPKTPTVASRTRNMPTNNIFS